jgi:hypothetical protein
MIRVDELVQFITNLNYVEAKKYVEAFEATFKMLHRYGPLRTI